jgi:hypothetical protein
LPGGDARAVKALNGGFLRMPGAVLFTPVAPPFLG